jgi:hypothetical protein
MRMICCVAFMATATPILGQTFEAASAELIAGSFGGTGDDISSFRLTSAGSWEFGALGLQVDGSIDKLDEENSVATARAILTTDLPIPVRLGASLSFTTDDGVQQDTATLGLHALYMTDDLRLDGALQFPDHINETGAFSFSMLSEQMVTPRIMITTDLYRLSMDDELQDYYSVGLGTRYLVNDQVTLIAEGYKTAADTYVYEDTIARLGMSYDIAPGIEITAFYLHRLDHDGTNADGLSVVARWDMGADREQARLFQYGPNADRFAIGAF